MSAQFGVAAVNGPAVGLGCGLVAADPLAAAVAGAKRITELPQQAVESTERVLNIHPERAVFASLDYALWAEHQSFLTKDRR